MAIRVGIVGLATMYWPVALAQNLKALPNADLRALATMGASDEECKNTSRITAKEYADKFGVRLYDGMEEMIEAERLDAVAICTRHTQHAEHVERAAARGVKIYVCKTMATTKKDAARIVAAGKKHGVDIAVGPGGRFQPHHVVARQVIESGRIGRPISLRVAHSHGTIDGFAAGDWYRLKEEGGPELSLGWYVIDVLRGLVPRRVVRVYAEYRNFTTPDSPFMDEGKVVLTFDDDTIGSCDMYFSNRFAFPTWDLEVIGTKGALRTHTGTKEDGVPPAVLWTAEGVEQLSVPEGFFWPADTAEWVNAFAEGRRPPIDAEEGRVITEISLACRESAEKKRAVEL
jgi:UDP-N-acetylglucosamine 3-dehydrogenase